MSSRASRNGHWLRPAVLPLVALGVLAALGQAEALPWSLSLGALLAVAMPAAILALAAALARVGGAVDLSLGASAALAGLGAAWLPAAIGAPPGLAVPLGIAAACLLGAVTGGLVHLLRAPAWLVSGLVLVLAGGLLAALGGAELPGALGEPARWAPLDRATPSLTLATISGQPTWPALPLAFWVWLCLLLVLPFKLCRTAMGNRVLALGVDASLAERLAMPMLSTRLALFAGTGMLAGIAGVLMPDPALLLAPRLPLELSLLALLAAVIGGGFGPERRRSFFSASVAALTIAAVQHMGWVRPDAGAALAAGAAALALVVLAGSRRTRATALAAP